MSRYESLVAELRNSVPNRRLMLTAADAVEELSKRIDRAVDIYNRNVEKTAMYEVLIGIAPEPPKEERFGGTEQVKQEYYHAFCSRCGRPVIAKKEEAFWWPGGTTDDHLCISCDVCGGLAEV